MTEQSECARHMCTCMRRPAGCTCVLEFGDDACPVHPTCELCGTLLRALDDVTGWPELYRGSCECGVELYCGLRGSVVRAHLFMTGQLDLTDAALLTAEELYTFAGQGAHT